MFFRVTYSLPAFVAVTRVRPDMPRTTLGHFFTVWACSLANVLQMITLHYMP
ncbi:hypothetical protein BH20ACI2_BH20ACI2_28370 [soil metagenome]